MSPALRSGGAASSPPACGFRRWTAAAFWLTGCCICTIVAFLSVIEHQRVTLFHLLASVPGDWRTKHAVKVSNIANPELYRRVWNIQQNVCLSIRTALIWLCLMLFFLSLLLPTTKCFCIMLSNTESLQYQQHASEFPYCVYLSYKSAKVPSGEGGAIVCSSGAPFPVSLSW